MILIRSAQGQLAFRKHFQLKVYPAPYFTSGPLFHGGLGYPDFANFYRVCYTFGCLA